MANLSLVGSVNGLGTFNFGVPNAGTYSIQGNLTLPSLSSGSSGSSSVVVTVTINGGSSIYTGTAGLQGFSLTNVVIPANGIINVILSSSAAVDQGLNVIKMTVSIAELS